MVYLEFQIHSNCPYQISHEVMIMDASERAMNILRRGFPFGPKTERATPREVAKHTNPMMFIPLR